MTSGSTNFKGKDTVVFMHENAGNIGLRLDYYETLCNFAQVNVLSIAYRGYSKSEGTPSELGLERDAIAIGEYLKRQDKFDNQRVYLIGRSLGGAVAVSLLSQK